MITDLGFNKEYGMRPNRFSLDLRGVLDLQFNTRFMSSVFIRNKFDGNDYRVSVVPVCKRASVPNPLERELAHLAGGKSAGFKLQRFNFDHIILEAAIFPGKKLFKPLFIIALERFRFR